MNQSAAFLSLYLSLVFASLIGMFTGQMRKKGFAFGASVAWIIGSVWAINVALGDPDPRHVTIAILITCLSSVPLCHLWIAWFPKKKPHDHDSPA